MTNLTNKELELRKWALEMSLKHGHNLFSYGMSYRPPSQIMSDAHKIMELVTIDWSNPIDDPEPY